MTTTPLGPESRVAVFVSSAGKVHRSASYSWGVGAACSGRFLSGRPTEALVKDIDCQHCMAHELPDTWEVRIPDRRYKVGYRVAHSGLPSQAEAEVFAATLSDKDAYVASVGLTEEDHEH